VDEVWQPEQVPEMTEVQIQRVQDKEMEREAAVDGSVDQKW
jgi:hypothetical protein